MAQLSLALLGPFQALLDGEPITGFESMRVRALLIYLAVEKARPHRRETLVELFWPEQPSGVGAANLRHALANLRKAIGDQRAMPPFLLITTGTLQFNEASNTAIDLERFNALLTNNPPPAACQAALTLYRSRFLEGFILDDSPEFALWLTVQRERVDYLAGQALAKVVAAAVQQGNFPQAISWTQRQLALDALNEDLHQQLIWLLAHSGQRAAALRHYDHCCDLLRQELAVEPAPALQTLVAHLRAGHPDLGVIYGQDGQVLAPPVMPPTALPLPILLPTPPTPFIGREAELALVAARLADPACRLLTIVGPGGIGKTRLALQAAAAAPAHFPHGVCFVELAAVATADQIPGTILAALEVPHTGTVDPRPQLVDYLRQRSVLLVLDNFEQLLDGAALLLELLHAAPGLKLLVTSRARLNLREEWLVPLEGLNLPPPVLPTVDGDMPPEQAPVIPIDDLERYDAPRFFLHCIRRLQPTFQPTPVEATAILQICRLLAGLPLGIELAAAWVRTLPLPAIGHEITHSLAFLTTSVHDMPARHRSMSAVFDHSWCLLARNERSILRQFSVFRGGCTRAAAAAVTGATLTALAELVDKSWLHLRADARYEMHELVRQYCAEKLASEHSAVDGETDDQVRSRHGAYFADYLADALGKMNYRQEAMAEVMSEMGNVLAGLQWAAQTGNVAAAQRMIIGIFFIAEMLGWYQFARQAYEVALALLTAPPADGTPNPPTADNHTLIICWLRWCQANLYRTMGQLERATAETAQLFVYLAHVSESRHQRWLTLMTHWVRTQLTQLSGDLPAARQQAQVMVTRFQEANFPALFYDQAVEAQFFQAHAHALLGQIAWQLGDYEEAQQQMVQALTLRDAMGEQRYKAFNLVTLATILQTVGEQEQASCYVQAARQISQADGDAIAHAHALVALARLEREQGAYALAREHSQSSLALGRQSGNHRLLMEALIEMGWIALALGQTGEAKSWFDEAIATFVRLTTAHSNYVAGALLGLGWTALADQAFTAARNHFQQTVVAQGAAAGERLDAVAGLAEVAAATSQVEWAIELLTFVTHAPGASQATKQRADQRLATLADRLPVAALTAATMRGQQQTLTTIMAAQTNVVA